MSFRRRIMLALTAAAVLPVISVGVLSYRANREELLRTVGRSQVQAATELARWCERFVVDRAQALQLSAAYIPFSSLSGEQLEAVLRIPLRQLPDVTMLAVVDSSGAALGDTLHRRPGSGPARDPEVADERDIDAFARSVPIESARASDVAIGPPYRSPSSGIPRVALAVRAADRFVVAELSLADADARLRDLGPGGSAFLVDASGRPFTTGAADVSDEERALFEMGRGSPGGATRTVRARGGATYLSSYAPVGLLGWGVVLEQPTSVAFRAADRVRRYTVFWAAAAVVIAMALGAFVARTLARPVADLSAAAAALTDGRYDVRIEQSGGYDELGRLGTAFNHMAREVQRRDDEIRRWNAELQQRVQERTTELRAAEDQIARARRLAAMGSLGAGVAHGLNNPMTSLLGLITLARREAAGSPAAELLETALTEGRKVVRIVDDLKRLTERERNEAGRAFHPAQPVRAAVEAQRCRLAEQRIVIAADLDSDVPLVQGYAGQVQELVAHLIDNAVDAMPDGGRLEVGLSAVEGDAVKLQVADNGRGIAPEIRERIFDPFFTTKTTPGAGLGLSLCHGIVEAHHGRIVVESGPGRGARFEVLLPAAARAAHLV